MTTRYRTRTLHTKLRGPDPFPRPSWETDDFIHSMHFGGPANGPMLECARAHCLDRWIDGVPEVTWLIGGEWRHFHFECVPKPWHLAIQKVGTCSNCGAPLIADGLGWRPTQDDEHGQLMQRMLVCQRCVTGNLQIVARFKVAGREERKLLKR